MRWLAIFLSTPFVSLWGILPEQVLIVFNSENADSAAVHDYYTTARPGVLSFDLADSSLLPGTISYADFVSKIRDPLRDHLNGNGLASAVHVIVLTKGIPHRIQDLNTSDPDIGDRPSAASSAYNGGHASYASVDSELTLLQVDLDAGESGGSMDSPADRAVYNPYFGETAPFSSFDRSEIGTLSRTFVSGETEQGWWRLYSVESTGVLVGKDQPLGPGFIYLVCRLDAASVEDVRAMIDRAGSIVLRRQTDALLFDADSRSTPYQVYKDPLTEVSIDDYAATVAGFGADWPRLTFDATGAFLIGETNTVSFSPTLSTSGPVAYLHSYGVNHAGGGERNYLSSFAGQLPPGAAFSAYESYGAAGLGGVAPPINQAQVTEWIAAGGTFATGPVWEPFTFGIGRSREFLNAFLVEGLTYAEAAWSSIMQLSWQTVVLGDPLSRATVIDGEPYYVWTLDQAGSTPAVRETLGEDRDFENDGISNGVEYGLDLSLSGSDAGSVILPRMEVASGAQLIFRIPDTAPAGVVYSIEASDSLSPGSWAVIATRDAAGVWTGSALVEEALVDGATEVTVTESATPPAGGQRFYRLAVSF